MVFTSLAQMVGVIVNAMIIATVVKMLDRTSIVQDRHDDSAETVRQWLAKKRVPFPLQQKVIKFQEHLFEQEQDFDTKKFLSSLPPALEFEMLEHLYIKNLRKTDLAKGLPEEVVIDLCRGLVPYPVHAGDTIFTKGEIARETYVIVGGNEGEEAKVQLEQDPKDGPRDASGPGAKPKPDTIILKDGDFFGENSLDWQDNTDVKRVQTATALTDAELLLLPAAHVEKIADRYPPLVDSVETFKAERKKQLEASRGLGDSAKTLESVKAVTGAASRMVTRARSKRELVEPEPEPEPEHPQHWPPHLQHLTGGLEKRLTKLETQQSEILEILKEIRNDSNR